MKYKMKYKKWTQEDLDSVVSLTNAGKTAREVADILDKSYESVKSYKVKLGLSKRSGTNTKRTEHNMPIEVSEYLQNNNMTIRSFAGMKGTSNVKCGRCEHTWNVRVHDLVHREQYCPNCSNKSSSKIANKWLDGLNIVQREFNIPGTKFRVDGIKDNTIYEFLGDFWHGNLTLFVEDDVNPKVGKTYGELFEETCRRFIKLKELGYTVVYIWEDDFNKGKQPEIF